MKPFFTILLIPFFLLVLSDLSAQVILYPTKTDVSYYKQTFIGRLKPVSRVKAEIRIVEYYKNNELTERQRSSMRTGEVLQSEYYKSGRPFGKWRFYNGAGEFLYQRDFTKLVYGDCDQKNAVEAGVILPKFGPGENDLKHYLRLNMKYSAQSRSLGTNGIVLINFNVDETGKVKISHICGDGLDGYCDLVVWELVEQMPRWKPATKDGKSVEVSYYLPVSFKLD